MYNNCKMRYCAVCIMQKSLTANCAKQEKFFSRKNFLHAPEGRRKNLLQQKERRAGNTAFFLLQRGIPERFTVKKGKTRGGDTAPSGPKRAEKIRFSVKRQVVCLKHKTFQTENALRTS